MINDEIYFLEKSITKSKEVLLEPLVPIDVNDVTKNQLKENLCETVDEVNDDVKLEPIMNNSGTREIKYPEKQIRSDKQLFSFYTGYANRLNSILLKNETNYRLK